MAEEIATGIVTVEVVNLEGYVPGVTTTLRAMDAKKLAEKGKVKIIGAEKQANKTAPAANKKGDK